jgi:hypothetical protein
MQNNRRNNEEQAQENPEVGAGVDNANAEPPVEKVD